MPFPVLSDMVRSLVLNRPALLRALTKYRRVLGAWCVPRRQRMVQAPENLLVPAIFLVRHRASCPERVATPVPIGRRQSRLENGGVLKVSAVERIAR